MDSKKSNTMVSELKALLQNTRSPIVVGPLAESVPEGPYDFIIYVDGGARIRGAESKVPSVSVGDGDSLDSPEDIDFLIEREKDFSDLTFALMHLPDELDSLELTGFVGGRLDHQLAVLGEIVRFISHHKLKSLSMTLEGVHVLNKGSHDLTISGTFSIMSLQSQEITISGAAKYALEKPTEIEALSSLGLSNEGTGKVTVNCQAPLILLKH